MTEFSLPGALRRIRRLADLSQRELGQAAGASQSAIAQAESGRRDLPVRTLAVAAGLAGLRLALVDENGVDVPGMAPDRARDRGRRRFPAHLDPQHTDELGYFYEPRRDRPEPWFTFARDRETRDHLRGRAGTPDDHPEHHAGSSPAARAAARRAALNRAAAEEALARLASGDGGRATDGWTCTCPAGCDELDDWSGRPVHVDGCPCVCDVG